MQPLPFIFKSLAYDAPRIPQRQTWTPAIFHFPPQELPPLRFTAKDFSDFIEWEKDILIHSESWSLDLMPRLVLRSDLIAKIAEKNPYKLARDNCDNPVAIASSCQQYGILLAFAHSSLQNRKDIVLKAISERPSSVQYASSTLKQDPEIIRACLSRDGLTLGLFPASIASQREWAHMAISQNGLALKYAKGDLKKDKDLVKLACSKNGFALQFAHEDLQKDPEIVKEAVHCEIMIDEFIESCMEPMPKSLMARHFVHIRSRNILYDTLFTQRTELISQFKTLSNMPLDFASPELKTDRELVEITRCKYESLTGRSRVSRVKKARVAPDLHPIAPQAGLVRVLPEQEFVGPELGLDLKAFLKGAASESMSGQAPAPTTKIFAPLEFIGTQHGIDLRVFASQAPTHRPSGEACGGAGAESAKKEEL